MCCPVTFPMQPRSEQKPSLPQQYRRPRPPVDAVRIPGNLNVAGTFTAAELQYFGSKYYRCSRNFERRHRPGTYGTSGNFLRSNGTSWVSQPFSISDIPRKRELLQNTRSASTSNFNISGKETAGGTCRRRYYSAPQSILPAFACSANPGISNLFAGVNAGSVNTTGAQTRFSAVRPGP